jgi:hypothetical protein
MTPRPPFRRFTASVALGLTLLAARPAGAAPPPPLARSLTGQAREDYLASKALVASGDFRGALHALQQAYDLSNDPRLLYDMAVCEKNLHEYSRMRTLLQRYEREAASTLTASDHATIDSALQIIVNLVGTVSLKVTPDGATVSVDGAPVALELVGGGPTGTKPLPDAVVLDAGTHVVRVEKEGFAPFEKSVDVKGGAVVELEVPLVALGTIMVTTDDAAAVSIDGVAVARGRQKVSVGNHLVRVTEQGRKPFESEVEVRAGENRTLEVTLVGASRPIWPWIVGGAVVVTAGVIVGGYFIANPSTTTTPPPPGKLGSVQFTSLRLR